MWRGPATLTFLTRQRAAYLGQLKHPDGTPIAITGLWDLEFDSRTPNGGQTNRLFFDAGPNAPFVAGYGLFGVIHAAGDQGGNGGGDPVRDAAALAQPVQQTLTGPQLQPVVQQALADWQSGCDGGPSGAAAAGAGLHPGAPRFVPGRGGRQPGLDQSQRGGLGAEPRYVDARRPDRPPLGARPRVRPRARPGRQRQPSRCDGRNAAGQDISNGFDAAMGMPGEAGQIGRGDVVAEVVEEEEGVEVGDVAEAECALQMRAPAPSKVGFAFTSRLIGRIDMAQYNHGFL